MSSPDLPRPFGPYTLLRRLAAGGMAEVYLAKSEGAAGFEKLVALKRLHPQHGRDQGYAAMLLDEARLSASLSHRNIVQTLDLGSVEGSYVIVMEHVDGYDAQQVLDALRSAGRFLSIDLAAHIIAELCRGLDYAHRHRDARGQPNGIVHRDVSPQNLLLSFAGEVKVADFGIAKAKSRRRDSDSGVIKGKYFYMSPEQVRAEAVDHRSDIFSAGIVFWELLVGRRLHQASEVRSLLESVRSAEVPPPSAFREAVPGALDLIVARATARDPDARYDDAGQMADALAAYLAGRPAVHAARQLGRLLGEMGSPSTPMDVARPAEIPATRDRVLTQPASNLPTPTEPPLRYDLEDGEPTVAGWRSPREKGGRLTWLWFFGAGALLVAAVARWLHGG